MLSKIHLLPSTIISSNKLHILLKIIALLALIHHLLIIIEGQVFFIFLAIIIIVLKCVLHIMQTLKIDLYIPMLLYKLFFLTHLYLQTLLIRLPLYPTQNFLITSSNKTDHNDYKILSPKKSFCLLLLLNLKYLKKPYN